MERCSEMCQARRRLSRFPHWVKTGGRDWVETGSRPEDATVLGLGKRWRALQFAVRHSIATQPEVLLPEPRGGGGEGER